EVTIKKVIEDTKKALPEADIYVYDNNSTDNTAKIAEEAGAIVRHEYMQGKGHVVRRMFREIIADCYILVDGDDTYPMDKAREMADLVLYHNSDMVVGDRLSSTYFTENKRPFHNTGNSTVRFAINKLFHCEIKDIMSGYRAMSYDFVKTFPVLSLGFEIETEMTIHAVHNNMQVDNVIIQYRDRPAGSESKLNTISDGIRVLKTIGSLFIHYKPLGFFSLLALLLILLSSLFFFPIYFDFLKTGIVLKIPTLIVCGFVTVAAIISLFSGFILSSAQKNNRREFELMRNSIHTQKIILDKLNNNIPLEK
ncbi:MAG: glycosyltransferase, partial [Solobacterium sp.]|nr:glycosyltransferase [Solobacterium sp.]